jgi:preprotein translocase subunit SecB
MDVSALQPLRLTVTELCVQANEEFVPPAVAPAGRVTVLIESGEGSDQEGNAIFRLRLTIRSEHAPDDPPVPYTFTVRLDAMFGFLPGAAVPDEDKRRLVAFSGVALLYGFARDVLLQATAFGTWGTVFLPLLNLTAEGTEQFEKLQREARERAGSSV